MDAGAVLEQMGIKTLDTSLIRAKNGVQVLRVHTDGCSFVLKLFEREEDRREIRAYEILTALGIPTLACAARTDSALLLEDIEQSAYRLGGPEDMESPDTAQQIAAWYRQLHEKGRAFCTASDERLYNENDVLTEENLVLVREKTGTQENPVWDALDTRLDTLHGLIDQTQKTLTYNDFYYTNLAVRCDRPGALMFDYNLLGQGYAYADIRNVCFSLGEKAGHAFCKAYGPWDEAEERLDSVLSVLTTLVFACRLPVLPRWADGVLHTLQNGFLLQSLHALTDGAV